MFVYIIQTIIISTVNSLNRDSLVSPVHLESPDLSAQRERWEPQVLVASAEIRENVVSPESKASQEY